MKIKTFLLAVITLFLLIGVSGCNKEEPNCKNSELTACGIKEPQKNIEWLSKLIAKAENDKTGNYWGTIWLEKYKGNDVFVTDMALGSGGIMYYYFDCQGNAFVPESHPEMKFNCVIYTNIPVD